MMMYAWAVYALGHLCQSQFVNVRGVIVVYVWAITTLAITTYMQTLFLSA